MGEPAGIGPDLLLAAYARRRELDIPPFKVFGHAAFLRKRATRLGLEIDIHPQSPPAKVDFDQALEVVDLSGEVPDRPGKPDPGTASVVISAIEHAVNAIRRGECRALVTAPIQKSALYSEGFAFPGHTEFLAALTADDRHTPFPVMMLAHEQFRVVPLTIHVPLSAVPGLISKDLIERTVRVVSEDLKRRFGIETPRLAVCGLNPHAGENGSIGREEIDIIAPSVAELSREGFSVEGPLPADTLFFPGHWSRYDCIIAMYHDQGLIPIKTIAFDKGVNVTLGLPIVRTSPDHGTALSLAGTGKASLNSMLAAIRMADQMTTTQN